MSLPPCAQWRTYDHARAAACAAVSPRQESELFGASCESPRSTLPPSSLRTDAAMQALRDELRLLATRLEKSDQERAEAREALGKLTNRAQDSEGEAQRAYVESALLALPCDKCADLGVVITTKDSVRLCAKCVRMALGEYLH